MITLKTVAPWNTGTEVMVGELIGHRLDGLINFLVDCRYNGVEFIELEEDVSDGSDTIWVAAFFDNESGAHMTFSGMKNAGIEHYTDSKLWAVRTHI